MKTKDFGSEGNRDLLHNINKTINDEDDRDSVTSDLDDKKATLLDQATGSAHVGTDLGSMVDNDHFGDDERNTESKAMASYAEKSSMRRRASNTKHKVVWSMVKMKRFLKRGV